MMDFQDMIHQVDKDGTGSLDFLDFLMMICLKSDVENAEDEIRKAFQVFDDILSPYSTPSLSLS